jgi:hypothetical protein
MGVPARVICVEVGGLFDPDMIDCVPRKRAGRNTGQPLARFRALGERLGYKLVCYTGNAIFVRRNLPGADSLPTVAPALAYVQNLARLTYAERYQLYRANLGLTPPYRPSKNPYLTPGSLGLRESDELHFVAARRAALRSRDAAILLRALARKEHGLGTSGPAA